MDKPNPVPSIGEDLHTPVAQQGTIETDNERFINEYWERVQAYRSLLGSEATDQEKLATQYDLTTDNSLRVIGTYLMGNWTTRTMNGIIVEAQAKADTLIEARYLNPILQDPTSKPLGLRNFYLQHLLTAIGYDLNYEDRDVRGHEQETQRWMTIVCNKIKRAINDPNSITAKEITEAFGSVDKYTVLYNAITGKIQSRSTAVYKPVIEKIVSIPQIQETA